MVGELPGIDPSLQGVREGELAGHVGGVTAWSGGSVRGSAPPCARHWLRDRYGLSWQIVPTALGELMRSGDRVRAGRVIQAMLGMKKIDIAGLRRAYEGA